MPPDPLPLKPSPQLLAVARTLRLSSEHLEMAITLRCAGRKCREPVGCALHRCRRDRACRLAALAGWPWPLGEDPYSPTYAIRLYQRMEAARAKADDR